MIVSIPLVLHIYIANELNILLFTSLFSLLTKGVQRIKYPIIRAITNIMNATILEFVLDANVAFTYARSKSSEFLKAT
jgi:hypothetical protein